MIFQKFTKEKEEEREDVDTCTRTTVCCGFESDNCFENVLYTILVIFLVTENYHFIFFLFLVEIEIFSLVVPESFIASSSEKNCHIQSQ